MKVNGVDVCFGKVVKVTLYYGTDSVTLLYAPQLDPLYNANIDITVEDIANPMRKNNELGFTAQLIITNPPPEAVQLISNHINWLVRDNENEEEFSMRAMRDLNGTLLDYYKNRVRCRVDVGYWDYEKRVPTDPEARANYQIPGLTKLFDGYINSSSLYHDGTDNIMKLACHNFNADTISTRAIHDEFVCHYPQIERQLRLEEQAKKDFNKRSGYDTRDWESMFRKLVVNFALTRPNPNYAGGTQEIMGMPSSPAPELYLTEADRRNSGWVKIYYIESPNDLKKYDEALRVRLQQLDVSRFYTNSGSLADMLTDLCNERGAMVNWMQYDDFDETHSQAVFFVWPRGRGVSAVTGDAADIKIINYQNLLESPVASASGALRVRMFLNPDCIPLKRIALILDPNIGSDTGTGNSFVVKASTLFRQSMGVRGQLSPYIGTQQLANAMSVYAQEVAARDIRDRGYLFNTGFPIVKCVHKISTLSSDWETVVETIPVWEGLHVKFGDEDV